MRTLSPAVLRYVGAIYGGGTLTGLSDGQLLERLTATNGVLHADAELAFAAILERHGRMVWCVCRATVLDEHDAEDAFQATFLILISKGQARYVFGKRSGPGCTPLPAESAWAFERRHFAVDESSESPEQRR